MKYSHFSRKSPKIAINPLRLAINPLRLALICGPSLQARLGTHFSQFSQKYVIFSQKHTFQILDAHFPKRFRLKPHINKKNLKKKQYGPLLYYYMAFNMAINMAYIN